MSIYLFSKPLSFSNQEDSEEEGVEGTADRLRRVKLIKSLFFFNARIV